MKKFLITIIVLLLIAVLGIGGYFVWRLNEKIEEQSNQISTLINEVKDKSEVNNTVENNTTTTNTTNTTNTTTNDTAEINAVGKYENKSETANYYHAASIDVTDQSDSAIAFSMSASHGVDANSVNVGEVSGIAKKEGNNKYVFWEVIEGKSYKITFTFEQHKNFQFVNVVEDYADNQNPYAGHNVSFEGEYEKIQ